MTYELLAPQKLEGTIALPSSKSISNRALVIHALAEEKILPSNLSDCDDTEVIIAALRHMPYEIDIKAAGTAMRFMTAYLSVTEGEHVITGTDRMRHRPIRILVDALRSLGADIRYEGEEGFPPLHIQGKKLEGGTLEIAGNVSSQYISALLMIGPILEKGLTLRLTGELISLPYIEMTLKMMREFGAEAEWKDDHTISVAHKPYTARNYHVESDWSAASYWYEMMALQDAPHAEVSLVGLSEDSLQGDAVIKDIFERLGVKTSFKSATENTPPMAIISRNEEVVERLDYDFSRCPDLAQTCVVSCLLLGVPFTFTGLQTLKIKETDRIEALKKEVRKLGYVIYDVHDDTLIWEGETCEPSHEPIATYEDHRMAMAFAPAAFRHRSLRIAHPEVVSKSYPRFWDDLREMGFDITII